MRLIRYVAAPLIVLLAVALHALGCTAFYLDRDGPVVAKSYDWRIGDALAIVNKRGVAKTSFGTTQPAEWVSRYGSITFNQYGRDMPCSGMDEAGLIVEVLALAGSEYPSTHSAHTVNGGEWAQYQLDNFSTVDEVLSARLAVRIKQYHQEMPHFFVCDRSGDCVVIQFLGGQMQVYHGESLPAKVIINHPYSNCISFLSQHIGFGGQLPTPPLDKMGSKYRFVKAATMVTQWNAACTTSPVDYAWAILANVKTNTTQRQIVYDVERRRIYFKTSVNSELRYVDFDAFDFTADAPPQVLDMNAPLEGNVSQQFVEYRQALNRDLIGRSFGKTPFLQDIPPEELDRLSQHPEAALVSP